MLLAPFDPLDWGAFCEKTLAEFKIRILEGASETLGGSRALLYGWCLPKMGLNSVE